MIIKENHGSVSADNLDHSPHLKALEVVFFSNQSFVCIHLKVQILSVCMRVSHLSHWSSFANH